MSNQSVLYFIMSKENEQRTYMFFFSFDITSVKLEFIIELVLWSLSLAAGGFEAPFISYGQV